MFTAVKSTVLSLVTRTEHRHQSAMCNVATESVRARGRARTFAWLRRIRLLVLATLVFTPSVVQAADFFVRTDGNNSNPGTTNSAAGAWLTIQKAADTMLAGDKTFVVTGTYNELVVPLNGGTAIDPIVYEALGNVVLNGGNTLCYAFQVQDLNYITIDGFEFTNYLDCGDSHANAYFDNSSFGQVLNNVFHDTGRDAIAFRGTSSNGLAHNNLIYNMDDDGITPAGSGNHTVRNNTIFNIGVLTGAGGWAMESAATAGNVYENNIFWDGIDNTSVATYSYNDYINGVLPGTGNISAIPLFINTAAGDFHLSQILSGQGSDSPAVDAGGVTAASLALDNRSTRTDSGADIGTVDQGYHYPNGISGPVLDIVKRAFLLDGTPIPTGATIPNFVEFKYLLYINNPGIGRGDVTVRDVLDPAFQYQAATIQVDNSVVECAVAVCTAAEELTIFTAVDGAAFLSDAVDVDTASFNGSDTVDAGDGNVANAQLNINADAVWAILFSVKMP